jgi:phenylpropionate dioxygenase-like ring-hydroxylating dioxygenase large terminal subunit
MTQSMKPVSTLTSEPSQSGTLPGWPYLDPGLFDREKEEIFFASWLYAGSTHQLKQPGDFLTADILGQSVIIIRGSDNELRGFHNVCQHRGHQLLSNCGNKRFITCPYHAWTYDMDGKLRSARGTNHMSFNPRQYDLKPVQVEVFADHFVFYNLDPSAVSLAQQAGDMAESLRGNILEFDEFEFQGSLVMPRDVQANWKVLVENYVECSHCAPTHPSFLELFDMEMSTECHRHWTFQKCGIRKRDNNAYYIGPDEKNDRACFYWLFPNTCFTVLPGDPTHVMVQIFHPMAIDRTNGKTDMYTPPGTKPNAQRNAWLSKVTGPEDRAVCESVQRGLQSKGFDSGRFLYDPQGGELTEESVYTFQRLVAKTLGL